MTYYYGDITCRWYVLNAGGEVVARLLSEADALFFIRSN
jgi:hypothetical protein